MMTIVLILITEIKEQYKTESITVGRFSIHVNYLNMLICAKNIYIKWFFSNPFLFQPPLFCPPIYMAQYGIGKQWELHLISTIYISKQKRVNNHLSFPAINFSCQHFKFHLFALSSFTTTQLKENLKWKLSSSYWKKSKLLFLLKNVWKSCSFIEHLVIVYNSEDIGIKREWIQQRAPL